MSYGLSIFAIVVSFYLAWRWNRDQERYHKILASHKQKLGELEERLASLEHPEESHEEEEEVQEP